MKTKSTLDVYNLRIPKPLKNELKKEAKAERRSLNQYLNLIIENRKNQKQQTV